MTATTKTVEYEDIGFRVEFAPSNYSTEGEVIGVDFVAHKLIDDDDEYFIKGFIKWDGCSNWMPPQDGTYTWHFCEVE